MKNFKLLSIFALIACGHVWASEPKNPLQGCPSSEEELKNTFNAIQKIHILAAQAAKDAKGQYVRATEISGIEPRTRQGIYLSSEQAPYGLITPWGYTSIYGSSSGATLFDSFRKRLKLKFVKNECEGDYVPPYGDKVQFYKENFQPITREEIDQYRGTDTNIFASLCGCRSIYEIVSVDGTPLPKAEKRDTEHPKKYVELVEKFKAVKGHWNRMLASYKNNHENK